MDSVWLDPHTASHDEMDWRAEHGPTKALPFKAFDDIAIDIQKPWIMKGVLARRETSSWVGSPGKGKSLLLTDIAVHVAQQQDWRGYKAKERVAVIYLALERADLLERRLEAYRRRNGLRALPIAVVRAPVNLMDLASVDILVDTIEWVGLRFGLKVGLLVLDTFAKAIAYGGGEENSAKDQNRVLGHLREVQRLTDVHVALIGHVGKDEAKGARGSNAHLGDVDMMVTISGDTVKTATITKANDQAEGDLTSFTVETFDFGKDEDDDLITTSILSDDKPEREPKARPKLPDKQANALDALDEVLIDFGQQAPITLQLPRSVKVVDAERWREELFRRGTLERSAPNPRTDYARIHDGLVRKKLIGFRDGLVWRVQQ